MVDVDGTRRIEYTCVRYVYSSQSECFQPTGTAEFTALGSHQAIERGGLSEAEAEETMARSGKNEINVHVPGIFEALLTEFADIPYVFNSMGTWAYMIFSTWNVGIFWLLITLSAGIFRSLFIVRPNQKQIRSLAQLHTHCKVLRDGKWKRIEAADIVLGDVLCIDGGSSKLPCDGIVVQGSLVVDESMLTGEPMPIQKMPVERSANASITKKNTAYAGTLCLESTGPEEGKALMIATAVGALTTRGQLVRMVLFPTSVRFKYNDQMPTVYFILSMYLMILCAIIVSPAIQMASWIATYLTVLATVAMCLNPMLPVSMVMGQSVTARRLEKTHKIGCLQPARIPIAGKISTMVFDKTGTITQDGMDLDAVVPVDSAEFRSKIDLVAQDRSSQEVVEQSVPENMRYALATCHTVTTVSDGTLVGNLVEVSMVQTSGWHIKGEDIVSPSGQERVQVLKKLDFDHCRMTSGVVIRTPNKNEVKVFVKGSYERISDISISDSVPASYNVLTQQYAKGGYYVLGVATKSLPGTVTEQELADMSRNTLEDGLSLCGLLLFRNEMKPDSPDAIIELKKGSIRSVICTGDNVHTGISIGKQCRIVSQHHPCLLGELDKSGNLRWVDPNDEDTTKSVDVHDPANSGAQLAVTQGAWRLMLREGLELEKIWTRLVVFGRMKPEDKINVVKYLQSQNLVVGMCGDGGNDCGGLRAAHAGLALSDAEASMVAPFSTARDGKSLMTVVDLIREGRACLATNIATFQYFVTYSFFLTTVRTVYTINGALNFADYVWIVMDVGIGIIMVYTMTQSLPTKTLADYRPTATLLGPRTISGILFPCLTALLAMFVAEALLWSKPWYIQLDPIFDIHVRPQDWNLRGDNYDSPIGVIGLLLCLSNTAYCNTYGGRFRRNILRNWKINIVYLAFLFFLGFALLAPPNWWNCIIRVNCDTKESLAAAHVPVIAAFSSGGVGGCFLGPQLIRWQEEMEQAGYPGHWLPSREEKCMPPPEYRAEVSSMDSPDISQFGCTGPNNCYPTEFRWEVIIVYLCYILVNHAFVKLVLQGPVASYIRRRQRTQDAKLFGTPSEDGGSTRSIGGVDSDGDELSSEQASDSDLRVRA